MIPRKNFLATLRLTTVAHRFGWVKTMRFPQGQIYSRASGIFSRHPSTVEEFTLYSDGAKVAAGTLDIGSVSPVLEIAPPAPVSTGFRHFGGTIVSLTMLRRAMSADEIKQLASSPADFVNLEYEEGSKPWPVQTRGQAGYRAPQDPSTMPRSKAPASRPSAKPIRSAGDRSSERRFRMDSRGRMVDDSRPRKQPPTVPQFRNPA